jgi:hypothetical protein
MELPYSSMSSTVRISIKVKPYRWKDFVHDVCFVLYAIIVISDALSKRYFHRTLRQLLRLSLRILKWSFWIFVLSLFIYSYLADLFGWNQFL